MIAACQFALLVCFSAMAAAADTDRVAWWRLDEGSGTAATDSATPGNHGTLHGPNWLKGVGGRSVLWFDGRDDYVEIPYDPNAFDIRDSISVLAWIFPERLRGWQPIVGQKKGGEDPQERWSLQPRGTTLAFQVRTDENPWVFKGAARSLKPGVWQHVAATWNGKTVRLYVDGQEKQVNWSYGAGTTEGRLVQATMPVQIGVDDVRWGNHFRGVINDVQVFRRALAPEQIVVQYRERKDIMTANRSAAHMAILAHRGLISMAPENTLPAFAIAVELGFDLEFDVYMTKDGRAVVIHDATVDRTTGGAGNVMELPFARVRALDAGSWFDPAFAGVRIPTLDEVLQLVKSRERRKTVMAVNMKRLSPGIEAEIVRLFERHDLVDHAFAFDMPLDSAKRFKAANPAFATAARASEDEPLDAVIDLDYINCFWAHEKRQAWITPDIVAAVHARGKKIYATGICIYTPSEWLRIIEAGVDGMCVNDAKGFRETLRRGFVNPSD